MTEDEIHEFAGGLPGVVVVIASEANGAPEVAWGDSFFFYDPDGTPVDRRLPFATIVTQDYDGFDTASKLDRAGVFRLNIAVGRTRFQELIGYPPAAHTDHQARFDFAALDRLLPHPRTPPKPGSRSSTPARGRARRRARCSPRVTPEQSRGTERRAEPAGSAVRSHETTRRRVLSRTSTAGGVRT